MNRARKLNALRRLLATAYHNNTRGPDGLWWVAPHMNAGPRNSTRVSLHTTDTDGVQLGEPVTYTHTELAQTDFMPKVREHCALAYKLHQLL